MPARRLSRIEVARRAHNPVVTDPLPADAPVSLRHIPDPAGIDRATLPAGGTPTTRSTDTSSARLRSDWVCAA